jgi:DNA-binding transcriptional MocR family regulator
VIVEDPGYMMLHAQLRAHGVRLLSVPRLPDGLDFGRLEDLVRRHSPRLLFTQTALHNPTGWNMTHASCHRLLMLAERFGFDIVEDDVCADLAPAGAPRLAQFDGLQKVLYVSSFSKVLSPSVRVGFLALASKHLRSLLTNKVRSVLGTSVLAEAAVLAALLSGRFPRHLLRLRSRLARHRQLAHSALARHGFTVPSPSADGIFIWALTPPELDIEEIASRALDHSIGLAPGRLFSPTGAAMPFTRLNAAYTSETALERILSLHSSSRTVRARVIPFAPGLREGDL